MATDQDLDEISRRIAEKQSASVSSAPTQPEKADDRVEVLPAEQASVPPVFKKEIQPPENPDKVTDVVNNLFGQAVVQTVATDTGLQENILNTAKQVVTDKADAIGDKAKLERQKSAFDISKDACENYGITKDVPLWKVKMMRAGSAFWFIIYFIIASVTVAPITIFLKGLKGSIKQIWLAVVLAVVFYLLIVVGIPLVSYLVSLMA